MSKEISTLNIPAEEIWTYKIDGMPAPSIGKQVKNSGMKKALFIVIILIAIAFSLYFGIRSVSKDTFEYKQTDGGYILSHFSNTGDMTELDISCYSEILYDGDTATVRTYEDRPVTEIGDYALNCDETVEEIHIGADVARISSTSFYTCKALKKITVDENNPCYCDIDGVLYSKDGTQLICCPIKHSAYAAEAKGYNTIPEEDSKDYEKYCEEVLSFTVPETVKTVGALAFNYTDIVTLYLPEGLETVETMAFFKAENLKNIYTYTDNKEKSCVSLPDSLTLIGSDAFSYTDSLEYIFIPSKVTSIGHHAFWDSGVDKINVALNETDFCNVETGTHWRPQPSNKLINQSAPIEYNSVRPTE